MSQKAFERVDRLRLDAACEGQPAAVDRARREPRFAIVPVSAALCVLQAVLTVAMENKPGSAVHLTSTLIAVGAFGLLFVLLVAVNPLLRSLDACLGRRLPRPPAWLWFVFWAGAALVAVISARATSSWVPLVVWLGALVAAALLYARSLNRTELLCVFTALLVTSGISTFGLSAQLIPLIATPWNPEWNTPQRGWEDDLLPALNPNLYLSVPQNATPEEREALEERILTFREGIRVPAPPEYAPRSQWWAYYREVCRQIPWSIWVRPLACWLIFIAACYGMFYCLTYILIGYWSDREKVIFPLARLPESLLPEDGDESRWLPDILKQPAFLSAFAFSLLLVSYNASISAELGFMSRFTQFGYGIGSDTVQQALQGTFLEGLISTGQRLGFQFILTAVGVAFLLPVRISFSIWFYFLFGKVLILIMVWMGYGQTGDDFPSNWLWVNNPVTAQGAGALLCFSGLSLYRCIRDFVQLSAGQSPLRKLYLCLPILGLAVSLAVLVLWLHWNSVPFFWALVIVVFLTLLTIGLMRIVAEGGIFWIQVHGSMFHIYKMLGLGNFLSPLLVGPLLPIYWVLFLDVKTFLAPNLLNAANMQKHNGRRGRGIFHFNLLLCIAITLCVSLAFAIFLSYLQGGQQMHTWFYSGGPQKTMDTALQAIETSPEFDPGTVAWYGIGAGWTAMSLSVRRFLFWFPHPIGYIMLVNPQLMASLWFSFFLGWIFKRVVMKYGGKLTFDWTRTLFIGLIMGELIAIFGWNAAALLSEFLPFIRAFTVHGIDLNRY